MMACYPNMHDEDDKSCDDESFHMLWFKAKVPRILLQKSSSCCPPTRRLFHQIELGYLLQDRGKLYVMTPLGIIDPVDYNH